MSISILLLLCFSLSVPQMHAANNSDTSLKQLYQRVCREPSDINEHIPVLHNLAKECSHVVEIGVRNMVSTWGILQGLSENKSASRSYLGIDLAYPSPYALALAERLANENEIEYTFWQTNDLDIAMQRTDLLFIDSLHTYCHLTYELEEFSGQVSKYIALHDTSAPWSDIDDSAYHGDYSEYPEWIDRAKHGLWQAVEDFLARHPEWILHTRLYNNHGFTILKRLIPLDESLAGDAIQSTMPTIATKYEASCQKIASKHMPLLAQLASACTSVTEIGVGSLGVTWSLLKGLTQSHASLPRYFGIDIKSPPKQELNLGMKLSKQNNIDFTFWRVNDMHIAIEPTEMLVIDTLHTFCHLTYQLEAFAKNVGNYICIFYSPAEKFRDDPSYMGDYSEYPHAYDRNKKGVWPAVEGFLEKHPEWCLWEHRPDKASLIVLQRSAERDCAALMEDAAVEHYLRHKMILCTGPSYGRYELLKNNTEADLSLIPFKKIFLTTNDPEIMHIDFNKRKPDYCLLLENWGKQLDCTNCIITSMKAAVNDPDVCDDDIIMFKHETVFINDLALFKRVLRKMISGVDLVVRTGMWGPCTDHFFVKVSAVRDLVKDYPLVTEIPYNCEHYFKDLVVNRISKVYNLHFSHSLWRFTQLGAYYIYPGYGTFDAEKDTWNNPWWNKSNYDELF